MSAIIPKEVTKAFILSSIDHKLWVDANNVLYDLCANSPLHKKESAVVAKLWLIGRSYAAPIERGAGGIHLDDVYRNAATRLIKSDLDQLLSKLDDTNNPTSKLALGIHALVMECLPQKNGRPMCRRSIASKYLHFHRPEQFVLFDSRAVSAAAKFVRSNRHLKKVGKCDDKYFVHAQKCEAIKAEICNETGLQLTNRQLDEVLLAIADGQKLLKKNITSTTPRYSRHRP